MHGPKTFAVVLNEYTRANFDANSEAVTTAGFTSQTAMEACKLGDPVEKGGLAGRSIVECVSDNTKPEMMGTYKNGIFDRVDHISLTATNMDESFSNVFSVNLVSFIILADVLFSEGDASKNYVDDVQAALNNWGDESKLLSDPDDENHVEYLLIQTPTYYVTGSGSLADNGYDMTFTFYPGQKAL